MTCSFFSFHRSSPASAWPLPARPWRRYVCPTDGEPHLTAGEAARPPCINEAAMGTRKKMYFFFSILLT
jgi:hypothetical protein